MKSKIKRITLSALSATLACTLTACADTNAQGDRSNGNCADTDTSSSIMQTENSTQAEGTSDNDFSPLGTPYIGPDGEELTVENVISVIFDSGYISYVKAGTPWEDIPDSNVRVKAGDKLDNGLKVNLATADVQINENSYYLAESDVSFEGELTLTGTLKCDQEAEPIGGTVGDLHFMPDSDNDIMLPYQMNGGIGYIVGNIHDENLPEGIEKIVNDEGKETANVKATIKRITVRSAFASSGKADTAILVSISEI